MAQPPSERRSNFPPHDHPASTNGTGKNGARPDESTGPAEFAIAPPNNQVELTEAELAELEQSAASSPKPTNGHSTANQAVIGQAPLDSNGSSNGLHPGFGDNPSHGSGTEEFDAEFELEPPATESDEEQQFIAIPPCSLPRPPFWHRLETKAAAIAMLCGLLSGALVGGSVYLTTSRLISQQAKQIQTQQTEQLADNIAAFLRDRTQEVNQIANSTTLASAGFWNQPLADKQQVLNRLQAQQTNYAALTIFNAQGQTVVQAPGQVTPAPANPAPTATNTAPPPNLGNADTANALAEPEPTAEPEPVNAAVQQVLASQQVTLAPATTPGAVLNIAAPIRVNGQFVGVLQAQIAEETVQPALVPAAAEPNQSYLVQSDGTLLTQADPQSADPPPASVAEAWTQLAQADETLVQQGSFWISAVPVPPPVAGLAEGSALSAVWVQPEFGVQRLPASVAYTIGIGALLAGLGSGALGAWAASRTVRSLRQATQAIQDLERDRRLPALPITGRDEAAVLERSVQSLATHMDQTRQTQVLELAELQDDVDAARQQAETIRDRIQHLQQEHQLQINQLQADTDQRQATWQQSTDQLRADHARQIDAVRADYLQQIERLQQDTQHGRQQQAAAVQQLEDQRRLQLEELRVAMQAVNQGDFDQPLPELAGELQDMAQAYSLTVRQLHQAKQQQARSQTRLAEIIAQLDQEIQSLQAVEQSFDPLSLWPTADQSLRSVSTTLQNLTHNMQQLRELVQSTETALAGTSATQPIANLKTLHQSSDNLQQQLEQIQPDLQQMTQTVLELSQITGQITLLAFNASLNLSRLPGDVSDSRQPLAKRLGQLRSLSQQSTQKTHSLTQQMAQFQQAITHVSPQVGQIATQVLSNVQSLSQLQQQLDQLAQLQQSLRPQLEQAHQTLADQPQPILGTLEAMQDPTSQIQQTRTQLAQITTTLQTILATAQDLNTNSPNIP